MLSQVGRIELEVAGRMVRAVAGERSASRSFATLRMTATTNNSKYNDNCKYNDSSKYNDNNKS
jgi:hypothetical protein